VDYGRRIICAVWEGSHDSEAGIQADIQNQLSSMGDLSSMTAKDNGMVKNLRKVVTAGFPHPNCLAIYLCTANLGVSLGRWGGSDAWVLKGFYEEYTYVTNALPGNIESYETSVLDAMEPTIRAVSAVGDMG